MDQTLHRVATKEREEIKRTTMQKMARRHNMEGENHLEQESNRLKTMEDIVGGLHPAVDGQSLGESEGTVRPGRTFTRQMGFDPGPTALDADALPLSHQGG